MSIDSVRCQMQHLKSDSAEPISVQVTRGAYHVYRLGEVPIATPGRVPMSDNVPQGDNMWPGP